jgi:hypothetical protein
MVEDNKERPAEEPVSKAKQIIAFFLTLIGLPFLFVGTCMPWGSDLFGSHKADVRVFGFGAYCLTFLGGLAFWAVRTKNLGVRLGIVVMGAIIACCMLAILSFLVH